MKREFIKSDIKGEIDWSQRFGVYALNLKSCEFENCSDLVFPMEVVIWDEYNDWNKYPVPENADYLLYDNEHEKCGYAIVKEDDEEETPVEKKKFVIRHYWKQWVDIVVEAEDEDEAFILADEIYDSGDYEDDPSNIENTDVENVTDYYEKNNISF